MAVSRHKSGIKTVSGGYANFRRWLFLSLAIHVLLAVLLTLSTISSKKVFYNPVYEVEILPAPEAVEPEEVPQKQEVRPAPVEKPAEKKIVRKEKKAAALPKPREDRAGYEDALAKLREKVAAEEAIEEIRKKVKNYKETVPDTSVKVAGRAPKKVYHYEELDEELRAYYDKIALIIRNAWFLPEALSNKGYKTVLSIHIRRDGTVESLWIEESSGNRLHDESTIRAINKLSTLPPLPKGWKGKFIDLGFVFP